MAVRRVYVLLISLLLYVHVSGNYCQSEDNPSIRFCQKGSISGSTVYINGSSVQTKEALVRRGCVCYLEQFGNKQLNVNAMESCVYCGLQLGVGNAYLRSSYYDSQAHGWGLIVLNDTKVTMTMGLDGSIGGINTAFCITIQANRPDIPVVLTLTCEGIGSTSSSTISTSPIMETMSPTTVRDTTKSQSPTSAETSMSILKTETTHTPEVSAGNTNATHGPKENNTNTVTTITTTANDPGEPRFHIQKEVIIPAAAGGGAGVLVILVTVIVVCCLRKKRQDSENPIYMKELGESDVIMTDNAAYGISVDTNTNSVPHIQAHCAGDVYAVVNKQRTSHVLPSAEVPHMQVGETGDVYAIVNKENVREIPNIEHSREKSAKSLLQTQSDKNNVTVGMTPSTDYVDITIDSDLL